MGQMETKSAPVFLYLGNEEENIADSCNELVQEDHGCHQTVAHIPVSGEAQVRVS